ncbi:MAG: M56 family metallopeptidase [Gemmatimonadota bacterium]
MSLFGWMFYSGTVGILVALAARCLDGGLSRLRVPTRGVWAVALALSVFLSLSALFANHLPDPHSSGVDPAAFRSGALGAWSDGGQSQNVPNSPINLVLLPLRTGDRWLALAAEWGAASLPASPSVTAWILGLWISSSVGVVALLVLAAIRATRARRGWLGKTIHGRSVRISRRLGPAVVGVVRPEIVIPRWATNLPEPELELVLTHEEEHVRARDPLLLAVGLLTLALYPWSPGVWWQVKWLRSAVEVDCDRRVLRRGVRPGAYATLLLRLGSRRRSVMMPTPALASSPSLLERRITAMKRRSTIAAIPPTLAGVAGAMAFTLLACGADVPVRPEDGAGGTGLSQGPVTPVVTVPTENGGQVQERLDPPEASPADEVSPNAETPGGQAQGDDANPEGLSAAGTEEAVRAQAVIIRRDGLAVRAVEAAPLVVVDGVIVSRSLGADGFDIEALDIESIEVVRAAEAQRRYGSRAARGAILIKTRTHENGPGN